jgi:hypothetical protein
LYSTEHVVQKHEIFHLYNKTWCFHAINMFSPNLYNMPYKNTKKFRQYNKTKNMFLHNKIIATIPICNLTSFEHTKHCTFIHLPPVHIPWSISSGVLDLARLCHWNLPTTIMDPYRCVQHVIQKHESLHLCNKTSFRTKTCFPLMCTTCHTKT